MAEHDAQRAPKKGRVNVPAAVDRIVWARAAGRCQYRNCNSNLIGHLVSGSRKVVRGFVAHVIAASAGGPRGHEVLSAELAKDPDNVMLLCHGCHRTVDVDHPEEHPAELLYKMKREHEGWVQRVLDLGAGSQSHILRFTNRIEANETAIPVDECIRSIMAIGRTPATASPIDLKLGIPGTTDSEDLFWAAEPEDLRRFCETRLMGRFAEGTIRHLSVFGFAPMPLLILLGRLIPDVLEVDVFTRHREPHPTWTWKTEGCGFNPTVSEGEAGPSRVALKVEITDRIADHRITDAVGETDLSIWSITCREPGYDVLRTREDLSAFRATARLAFNRIKEVHGEDASVMVFPAAPTACCIELGRVWQPKAHRPMAIYDQVQGRGFLERLVIK